MSNSTAGIIIIGDEILSGRTKDTNSNFIANELVKVGIKLEKIVIVPDQEKIIIENVKEFKKSYSYVFTTGGIGPTHDDITAECMSKAFNKKLILNKTAHNLLKNYYKKTKIILNESRLKMAYLPASSKLIKNSVSAAPGFKIKNVWVMAGVPKIMQAMFLEDIEPRLSLRKKIFSKSIKVFKPEGDIAKFLGNLQNSFKSVEIGSYPFYTPPDIGTTVIFTSLENKNIINSTKVLCKFLTEANIQFLR